MKLINIKMERLIQTYKNINDIERKLKDASTMSIEDFKKLLKKYKTELSNFDIYYNEFKKLIEFIDYTIEI